MNEKKKEMNKDGDIDKSKENQMIRQMHILTNIEFKRI